MRMRSAHLWLHLLLLLLWMIVGLGLRLLNLTGKPLWTDEFSTIVFGLGNSFLTIPIDQVLTTEQLLQPLEPNSAAHVDDVVRHLLQESNHPPLYFVLTHLWLQFFPAPNGWASVWAVRSLSVLFGTFTIPASFGLGWFAFRSPLVGQIAAALMAVSPFGIYLAQEARHYTLPLLWIIASLCCLIAAARTIHERAPLPIPVCLTWIVVNTLAIATHYLTILTLLAEGIVMLTLGLIQSWREQGIWHPFSHWWRIVAVAIGTMAGGMVWLPYLQDVPHSRLTAWIQQGDRSGLEWLDPIAQSVAGWVSMLYLLPIQAASESIVIASGLALIGLVLWTIPKLYQGFKVQDQQPDSRLSLIVLGSFISSSIVLFFTITYLFDRDLTSALRYNFVYYPAVIVVVAAALSSVWTGDVAAVESTFPKGLRWLYRGTARTVILIGLISGLGGLTVALNLGYQKIHRPDIVAQDILARSQGETLIAIAHETHGQTGRMMGIAWALQQAADTSTPTIEPRFLLAHLRYDSRSIVRALRRALGQLPTPLNLWLINFRDVPDKPIDMLLDQQNCQAITKRKLTEGYRYRLYRCGKQEKGNREKLIQDQDLQNFPSG